MRYVAVLSYLLVINSLPVLAQEEKFGIVTAEDFQIIFEEEMDAPAIKIFDVASSKFINGDNGFDIYFTRTVRIKINNKEGLAYGEVGIPMYKDGFNRTEYTKDIRGYTYLLESGNVKRIPLGTDLIFEEEVNDRWSVKKFAMPSVRENSIIEYQYTLITPFLVNLPDWEFQSTIPTLYSQYQVALNPFYEYSYRLQGASRFDHQSSQLEGGLTKRFANIEYNDMIHVYAMKNIPSFVDESFITTRQDYIMKLDFQLAKVNNPYGGSNEYMTTWEKLNETYLKEEAFGKYLDKSGKYAREIIDKMPPDADKLRWIVEYVRENYTWNDYFGRLASVKPKEFAEKRTGSSTEINLFLCAALTEAGLDAKPVLISTRNHGKIHSNYPFADQFNSVIVLVNMKDGLVLTDGTEKYIPYNTIPPVCINGQGLIVDKNDGQFVELSGYTNSQQSLNLSLNPDLAENIINGGVLYQAQGYEAYRVRKLIDKDLDEYKENAEEFGISGITGFETSSSGDSKFVMKYEGHSSLERLGENIIIAPFLNWPEDENPLKSQQRRYPVDMTYARRTIFSSQIKLPENYVLEDIPEAYTADNNLVRLTYSCKILGEHIVTQGEVNFKKSVYSNNEYARLRNYYSRMVELFNQELILVKKKDSAEGE